ncbi:hypothetical protein EDD86DRAFT_243555 [Gorgonomyces haynaldii]|nr:hypothetical protein EDD86DRAFT_243555 [Gorgonomyces haynaldii]
MGDGVGMNQLVHDDSEDVQMAVEALTEIRRETFVSRVSNIPLVNRSISNLNHAYQVTKNSSGIVKYSAESVENGVRTITGPILSTIQSNISYITGQKKDLLAPPQVPLSSSYQESFQNGHTMRLEEPSRYGWGKIVGGVGANLGMISDESMRGLRYCHAIHNVEVQIGVLASAISKGTMVVGGSLYSIVNNVKREIVETLRRVVDMLGKHSANYLPVDARATVKGFILNLPSRKSDKEIQRLVHPI